MSGIGKLGRGEIMHVVQIENVGYVSRQQLKDLGYPEFVMNVAEGNTLTSMVGRWIIMLASDLAIRYEKYPNV